MTDEQRRILTELAVLLRDAPIRAREHAEEWKPEYETAFKLGYLAETCHEVAAQIERLLGDDEEVGDEAGTTEP